MKARTRTPSRAVVLILTWIGGSIGHEAGDYLVQRDVDAQNKHKRSPVGRKALWRHCFTYAVTQALVKALLYRIAGARVPATAQLAGGLSEMVLHAAIDDGRPLKAFAASVGKQRFHDLADGGVNGRMLLDQAAHKTCQVPVGAVLTALLAERSCS